MSIEDLWYKHAVIYCMDVERYLDANGDGVGDFEGLMRRLDYLKGLGVTCLWLQPFYPSPNRDNGYDVADYYGVGERYGSAGDYVEFMNQAHALGLRVIVDLVVSHTSIDHPWFQSACRSRQSPFRSWYVWADERPKNHDAGVVFPGKQKSNWTRDEQAGQFYFHRFYNFQADLNTHHPAVRNEIRKIMGYWLELGVSGFRMDAVPFLIERKGAHVEAHQDFDLLHEMRDFLQWRRRDAILLAEANVPPEESVNYFGEQGDRLQMMLNFPVNQRLFYALASGDTGPLEQALVDTRERPAAAQWVQFLRSHDELDLGRLTEQQRQRVFAEFGPEPHMQLYGRGIRRRLAPMLSGDRRRQELAFSLLLSLPGTPMLLYGDEIGMGDDFSLEDREAARTPMQWNAERHGGFSRGATTVKPVIDDEKYGYRQLNVAAQLRDRDSLLNWLSRAIRFRQDCQELGWGDYAVLKTNAAGVLALRYDWRNTSLVTLHNFTAEPRQVQLDCAHVSASALFDVFRDARITANSSGAHHIELEPYGHRWYRVGAADTALDLTSF